MRSGFKIFFILFLAMFLSVNLAIANPEFSHTESGNVRVEENGPVYNIYSTNRSIGAFNTFGNQAGETINSIQASATDSVIFKVIGTQPSVFFGALNANSHVFLVNPNGIIFEPGSQVNAPGLLAAAMDLKSADFNTREFQFERNAAGSGYVLNEGNLQAAQGGFIALIGAAVENRGSIETPGGTAVLASGSAATVGLDGDGGISVKLTKPVNAPVFDLAGHEIKEGLLNSGIISASGGVVRLSASAAEAVFDQVINLSGVVEAKTVQNHNGVIVLDGGDSGIVGVSGSISARGENSGEKGGDIQVTGENVAIFGAANLDASGQTGGGQIFVGGGAHGEDPGIRNAQNTIIAPGAHLTADATVSGDGGNVVVWSDVSTQYFGIISARGALEAGNGGSVEISGLYDLVQRGSIDVGAAAGKPGSILYDPLLIQIVGGTGDGSDDPDSSPVSLINANGTNINGKILFSDEGNGPPVPFLIFESEIESTSASLVLEARQSITTAGTFTNSDILILPGRDFTLETRNTTSDGAGGIDLTTSSSGSALLLRTQGTGSITIESSTSGQALGQIALGNLQTDTGSITVETLNGDIVLHGTNIQTNGGDISMTPGSGSVVRVDPGIGNSLSISTVPSPGGNGGNISFFAPIKPSVSGIDLSIDASAAGSGNNGGSVMLPSVTGDSGIVVANLTVTASGSGGGSGGPIALLGRTDFDGTASFTGGPITMSNTGEIHTPNGNITLASDSSIQLGFLDANSDGDSLRGNVSVIASNAQGSGDILDGNGNGPNVIANTATFSTPGSLGQSSDPIEIDAITLHTSGVLGSVFVAPLYQAPPPPPPGGSAGVTIEGNRIVGGENYQEYLGDTSTTTSSDNSSDSGTDQKREQKGDSPAYIAPGAALPAGPSVAPPPKFQQESTLEPATFSACSKA